MCINLLEQLHQISSINCYFLNLVSTLCILVMSTPAAPVAIQPRGIDYSLPTCGETQCNGHGTCVSPPGGGTNLVCECALGYQGQFCGDTVNGALSVPLTISVIAAIIGVLVIAFIIAKIRQRQKKNRRRQLATKQGYNISV